MKFKAIFIDKERKITSIFLDIFIVIFFSFLLSNNLDLSINIFYALFNSILWFFISYTVGRYYTYITQRNIASLNRFATGSYTPKTFADKALSMDHSL